jgi:hypothetical protein
MTDYSDCEAKLVKCADCDAEAAALPDGATFVACVPVVGLDGGEPMCSLIYRLD